MSATWLRMRRRATTGSLFGSNLTKKMPQGWLRRERAQALDLLDLRGVLRIDAELLGRVVEEIVTSSKVVGSIGQPISSRR